MQTENSNKTSPNENISSLTAARLLFLLCAVGTSWVAEVPGGAGSPGRGDAAPEGWWPGGKGCGWPGPGGAWGHQGVKGGSRRGWCWWRCEPDTDQHRSLLLTLMRTPRRSVSSSPLPGAATASLSHQHHPRQDGSLPVPMLPQCSPPALHGATAASSLPLPFIAGSVEKPVKINIKSLVRGFTKKIKLPWNARSLWFVLR